jgi:AcrR family transcriptional regulator
MYRRSSPSGFGKKAEAAAPRSKPLKRPTQARGKFTVQAIYEAFVRIWLAQGWEGVNTRAVALEAGVAIGTLYDYFPDKEALFSGYARHCIDALLARLEAEVVAPSGLPWRERLQRLVRLTCTPSLEGRPSFDREMALLEYRVVEPKHHRRVWDELSACWLRAFAACSDLARPVPPVVIHALLTMAWGGWRYRLLLQPEMPDADWIAELETTLLARVDRLEEDSAHGQQ